VELRLNPEAIDVSHKSKSIFFNVVLPPFVSMKCKDAPLPTCYLKYWLGSSFGMLFKVAQLLLVFVL
jgi:hypothetical protein